MLSSTGLVPFGSLELISSWGSPGPRSRRHPLCECFCESLPGSSELPTPALTRVALGVWELLPKVPGTTPPRALALGSLSMTGEYKSIRLTPGLSIRTSRMCNGPRRALLRLPSGAWPKLHSPWLLLPYKFLQGAHPWEVTPT